MQNLRLEVLMVELRNFMIRKYEFCQHRRDKKGQFNPERMVIISMNASFTNRLFLVGQNDLVCFIYLQKQNANHSPVFVTLFLFEAWAFCAAMIAFLILDFPVQLQQTWSVCIAFDNGHWQSQKNPTAMTTTNCIRFIEPSGTIWVKGIDGMISL